MKIFKCNAFSKWSWPHLFRVLSYSSCDDVKMKVACERCMAYKANGIFDCAICFVSGYLNKYALTVFAYVKLGCSFPCIQSPKKRVGGVPLTSQRHCTMRHVKTCPYIWMWFIGQLLQINFESRARLLYSYVIFLWMAKPIDGNGGWQPPRKPIAWCGGTKW